MNDGHSDIQCDWGAIFYHMSLGNEHKQELVNLKQPQP